MIYESSKLSPSCHQGMYYFVKQWLLFLIQAVWFSSSATNFRYCSNLFRCTADLQCIPAITCVFTFIQTKKHHHSTHISFKCYLINPHFVSININNQRLISGSARGIVRTCVLVHRLLSHKCHPMYQLKYV